MSARNEFPHHGSADQAGPSENEHTHDLPLLLEARSSDGVPSDHNDTLALNKYCGAARIGRKNVSIEIR
jgi:hypothetical protein